MVEKYVKIIANHKDLENIRVLLQACNQCLENSAFKDVLASRIIPKNDKLAFLLDVLKALNLSISTSFINLLKLMCESNNLHILGHLSAELEKQIERSNGIECGYILTKSPLADDALKAYEDNLSKRFSKKICLKNKISKTDEVRIILEDLGYEISLSNQMIQRKIKEYIIKAI